MPIENPYVEQDRNYVYDTNSGTWVRMTQPATGGATSDVNIAVDSVGLAKQAQLPASLGQKTSANSLSVVVASDNTVAVSAASLPLPSGAANQTKQDTGNASLASIDGKITAVNTGAVVVSSSALPSLAATSTKQSDGSQKTQVVDGSGNVIGATSNALDVNIKSGSIANTSFTVTQATGTNLHTVIDSGTVTVSGTVTANPTKPSSSSVTSVASSASNVTLLASNSNRRKFIIFNDSTQTLYVKQGTTASSSSYTFQLSSNQWYESFVDDYTGNIDGIWASANGNARITEIT